MLLAHKYKMHTFLADVVSALHEAFKLTAESDARSPHSVKMKVQGHLELVVTVAAAASSKLSEACKIFQERTAGVTRWMRKN